MANKFVITARLKMLPPTNTEVNRVRAVIENRLKGISVDVNVKTSAKSVRNMKTTQRAAQNIDKEFKKATNTVSNFGEQSALAVRRFAAFTIVTSGVLGFTSVIKNAFSEAIEFERELIKIAQVSGTSINQLGFLTKEIDRLATTFGVSSRELLTSARVLAQTGLSASDTKVALEALAKSDLAPTFENINNTTEAAIAIFNQFGVQANELEASLGAINAVSGRFAVESGDIAQAIRRAGGAFKAAGGDLNELLALFTSVRSTTRESAQAISTGLRTISTRLQRERTVQFLENFGVELRDAGQFVGPLEAIEKLNVALGSIPSTDIRFAQIVEQIGGLRQISRIIPLIQQFDVAQRALGVAERGTTSLTEDAATAQQALAVQIKKASQEFSALIREISRDQTFRDLLNITLRLSRAFVDIADNLRPLIPLIGTVGAFTLGRSALKFGKGFFEKVKGAHDGGLIQGFAGGGKVGSTDTVPAMLTPGEFVIRKKAVDKIGVDKLKQMNQGFQAGGLVGPKNVLAGGAGLAIGAALLTDFDELGEATQKVINSITTFGAQLVTSQFLIGKSGVGISEKLSDVGNDFTKVSGLLSSADKELRQTTISFKKEFGNNLPAAARKRIDSLKKNRDELSKNVDVLARNRQELEKTQKSFDRFTIGMSLISSALVTFGNFLSDTAQERIRSGEDASVLAGAGKATSQGGLGLALGAGVGGLIGSFFGGPAGALAGAKIGSLVSGITGATIGFISGLNEAEESLRRVEFDKTFKNLNKALDLSIRGEASGRLGTVRRGVSALFSRQLTATGDDLVTLQGSIDSAVPKVDEFFSKVAKSSSSIDQFTRIIGEDAIQQFSLLSGSTIPEVIDRFNRLITVSQNNIRVQNNFSQLQRDVAQRTRDVNNITSSIDAVSISMQGLNSRVDLLSGGFGRLADVSSAFESIGQTGTSRILENIISNVSSLLGARGAGLANRARQGISVSQALPDVLLGLRSQDLLGSDGGDFLSRLEADLRGTLPDITQEILNVIVNRAESIIGPSGNVQSILSKIDKDPLSLARDLSEGISDNIITVFEQGNKLISEQLSITSDILQQRNKLEALLITQLTKVIGLREQKEKTLAEARGREFSGGKFDDQRQKAILGRFSNVSGNPADISNALTDSQKKLLEIDKQLFNVKQNETSTTRNLIEARAQEIDNIARLKRGLEDLANASTRVARLQTRLTRLQESQAKKFNFVSDFIFGSVKERRESLKTLAATGAVKFGQAELQQIPPDLRKNIQGLLRQFADVKLPVFGGSTGRDVERKIVEQELITSGVDDKKAKEIANIVTTPQEEKLVKAIGKEFDRAIEAQNLLAKATKDNISSLMQINEKGFTSMVSQLQKNLEVAEQRRRARLATSIESRLQGLKQTQQLQNTAKQFVSGTGFQFGPDFQSGIGTLLGIIPLVRDFKKIGNQIGRLQKSRDIATSVSQTRVGAVGGPGAIPSIQDIPTFGKERVLASLLGAGVERQKASKIAQLPVGERGGEIDKILKERRQQRADIVKGERVERGIPIGLFEKILQDNNLPKLEKQLKSLGGADLTNINQQIKNLEKELTNLNQASSNIGNLQQTVVQFGKDGSNLAQAMNNFPSNVEHNFNGQVEVVVNGAQILTELMPQVQKIVTQQVKQDLGKLVGEQLPQLNPIS